VRAEIISRLLFLVPTRSAFGLGEIDLDAMGLVFENFRKDAAASTDSVERTLLDQMLLAHLKTTELHEYAATTSDPSAKQTFLNASIRLVGAITQLTHALVDYRASAKRRKTPAVRKITKKHAKRVDKIERQTGK
jgi:hypothetical protein